MSQQVQFGSTYLGNVANNFFGDVTSPSPQSLTFIPFLFNKNKSGNDLDKFTGTLGAIRLAADWLYYGELRLAVNVANQNPMFFNSTTVATVGGRTSSPTGYYPFLHRPNFFDLALNGIVEEVSSIDWVEVLGINRPKGILMPEQAQEFRKFNSIPTPGNGSLNNVIFSWTMPTGWEGIIYAIYQDYNGPFYVQGVNDLRFRGQINRRWLWSSQTSFLFGEPNIFSELTDYVSLKSGVTFTYTVDVLNITGTILPGVTNILAGIQGWIYPLNRTKKDQEPCEESLV